MNIWATRITFFISVSPHSQQIEGPTICLRGITLRQDFPEHVTLLLRSGSVEAAWPETPLQAEQEDDAMGDKGPPAPRLCCSASAATRKPFYRTGPLRGCCVPGKYSEAETFGLGRKWKCVPLNWCFWLINQQGYFLRWPWLNFSSRDWKQWFNFQEN